MRRLLMVGVGLGLSLGAWVGQAAAAPNDNKELEAIGGFQTADAVVRGAAGKVAGVSIDCGASACTASLYDGDETSDMTNANGRFEISAAANDAEFIDLRELPIQFNTGIVLNVDGNQDAVVVYRAVQ